MENFETYRLDQTGQQTQAILDQVSTNTADIAQLRALYEALTQREPVIIQPSDTWPVDDPQENVIYRVIDRVNTPPQSYSDYMWNGTAMVLMAIYNNAIDNEPTPGSNNLVKSGGVAASIVFDISAYHATGSTLATYANLAAALGTDGANVPASVRKGGMSVKFVKSSDNKYVQYRLMANSFSVTVSDWQGVDDKPTDESHNLIESGAVKLIGITADSLNDYDNLNVRNINNFTNNKVVNKQGYIEDNPYFKISDKLFVKEGQKVIVDGCYNDNSNFTQLISAYTEDGTFDLLASVNYEMSGHYVYTVPESIRFIIVASLNTSNNQNIRIMNSTQFSPNRMLLNDDDFIDDGKFYTPSGTIESNSSYHSTEYLPIVGVKKMSVCANMDNPYIAGIAFFDENLNYISCISEVTLSPKEIYNVPIADIPVNAVYCKVAAWKDYSDYVFVDITLRDGAVCNAFIKKIANRFYVPQKNIYSAKIAALTQGNEIVINDTPSVRNSYIINARAEFVNYGQLMLYKGIEPYLTGEIKIDGTNLYAFSTTGSGAFNTYPHGLTISQFINISIIIKDIPMQFPLTGTAVVKIVTASGSFEQEVPWMGGKKFALYAENGDYTNVNIELSVAKKRNWVFADSYADFWCPFINKESNILIDSYSGRNSYNAYLSLIDELKTHLPERIIWAMGMNDGDTDGVVNADWKYYYDKVIDVCKKYGIQLIFVTIPNTPIVTNYYKNQIIKNSEYDYIDIAAAVGATEINSGWYQGLLGSDNVHPSDLGTKIIAEYLSSYFIS